MSRSLSTSKSKKVFAGLLIASALGAGAAPATAALSECPSGTVCLFKDSNFSGLLGYRSGGNGLVNISYANNDEMSSWANKSNWDAAWYSDANGGGSCYDMDSQSTNSYVGYWFNDRASSWRTNTGC